MKAWLLPYRGAGLLPILAVLVGCAQLVWVKPGATDAERLIEQGRCESDAYMRIPPAPATAIVGGGFISPMVTSCSGSGRNTNCITTGGFYTPPTVMTYDANRNIRNEMFSACMYAAGWSLRKTDDTEIVTKSAWRKGYDFGVRNREPSGCDREAADVMKAGDWLLGCQAGQHSH